MDTGRQQSGVSLVGLVLIAAAISFVALIGLRMFPIFADYWTVQSIAKSVVDNAGVSGTGKAKVREQIRARFQTNQVRNLKPSVIRIEYSKSRNLLLVIDYEDRRPLIANLDIVAKFDRTIGSNH